MVGKIGCQGAQAPNAPPSMSEFIKCGLPHVESCVAGPKGQGFDLRRRLIARQRCPPVDRQTRQ